MWRTSIICDISTRNRCFTKLAISSLRRHRRHLGIFQQTRDAVCPRCLRLLSNCGCFDRLSRDNSTRRFRLLQSDLQSKILCTLHLQAYRYQWNSGDFYKLHPRLWLKFEGDSEYDYLVIHCPTYKFRFHARILFIYSELRNSYTSRFKFYWKIKQNKSFSRCKRVFRRSSPQLIFVYCPEQNDSNVVIRKTWRMNLTYNPD